MDGLRLQVGKVVLGVSRQDFTKRTQDLRSEKGTERRRQEGIRSLNICTSHAYLAVGSGGEGGESIAVFLLVPS